MWRRVFKEIISRQFPKALLEKVIAQETPEGKKKKIKDLCRTRWVYRHKAYETFLQLLPAITLALGVFSLHTSDFVQLEELVSCMKSENHNLVIVA